MKWLPIGVLSLLLFASGKMTLARDTVYEGAWHTTNRKLDGIMTCTVSDMGTEKWKGRFYGRESRSTTR